MRQGHANPFCIVPTLTDVANAISQPVNVSWAVGLLQGSWALDHSQVHLQQLCISRTAAQLSMMPPHLVVSLVLLTCPYTTTSPAQVRESALGARHCY